MISQTARMIETEPVWGGRVAAACGRGDGWSGGVDDWNLTLTGDLNSDKTTPADAAIALKLAASGGWDPAADVNRNSRITPLGALMILQAAGGAGAITL